jgi:hypothetical protein
VTSVRIGFSSGFGMGGPAVLRLYRLRGTVTPW